MLLVKKRLKKLVLVITDIATKEALERWQFDIATTADIEFVSANEKQTLNCNSSEKGSVDKDEKRIKQEISDVLRFG